MKLSINFLRDYIDVPVDANKLGEDMTGIGNEYDSAGKLLDVSGLVIGKIIECKDHPNSDHLHLCKVDVGNEVLNIVCGAPNAREGIKVIVALVNAKLPGGVIKKGKIRGEESCGMLCSVQELGLEHKYLKPEDIEGIAELGEDAVIGEDPIKYLGLDDEVIDFELTANRGDLLSIIGMAYEIAALYDLKIKDMDLSYNESEENFADKFHLNIKTDNCTLFYAKKVENVVIKESPKWLKNRLIASGIRPINNVVDISNYVMLEVGQPLHYYDADRLGDTLTVRMAEEGEVLTTLDGKERILSKYDIVIADKEKAIGLAGVMGGLSTEVEEDTKNIVIESAIFNPTKVRLTSKKILRSEASNRFEKGLDPKRSMMAIERSCHLLEKYADAKISGGLAVYDKANKDDRIVEFTFASVKNILGIDISLDDVLNILRKLRLETEVYYETDDKKDARITVHVPSRRWDLQIKEDIIHDIGRYYGMDNIEGKKMILPVIPGHYDKFKRAARNKMVELGLNETLSYALIPVGEVKKYSTDDFEVVKILDPMTEERNALRYSLLPSLKMIYDYNRARNEKDISIFEIGKSFFKKDGKFSEHQSLAVLMSGNYKVGIEKEEVNFYVIKGVMEELLDYLGFAGRYRLDVSDIPSELHPGQVASIIVDGKKEGIIGKVHPNISSKENIFVMELNLEDLANAKHEGMKFAEISKYPNIAKDVAFIISKETKSEDIENVIRKAGGKKLISVKVFDVYEGANIGDDKRSIAYTLTFNDKEKTLSDDEVLETFKKIITKVTEECNATVRDA